MPDNHDHRNKFYTFHTELSLVEFYSPYLDKSKLVEMVRSADDNFVARYGDSADKIRLEKIKKAQWSIERYLKRKGVDYTAMPPVLQNQ